VAEDAPVSLAPAAVVKLVPPLLVPEADVVPFCTLKKFAATRSVNPASCMNLFRSKPILAVTFAGGLKDWKSDGT
jgi:hypothetical protein